MHIKVILLALTHFFFLTQFITAQKKINNNDSILSAPPILYWNNSEKEYGVPATITNTRQDNNASQRVNDSAQHVPILKTDSIEFLPGTTRKASKINTVPDKAPPNSTPLLIYDNKFR